MQSQRSGWSSKFVRPVASSSTIVTTPWPSEIVAFEGLLRST